jgi:hypothetical protein
MSTTAHDPEEPPVVQRLIIGGIESGATALRAKLRAIDQRILVWCWGIGAVVLFVYVLIGSIVTSPSILEGLLKGVFGGFFIALLFAVGFGTMMLWARREPGNTAPRISTRAGELDARLAPALRELTALRKDIIVQVKERSVTRVPLGIAGGIAAWVLAQQGNRPPELPAILLFALIGALAGEYWASHKLSEQYRRRYKDKVLPQIASELGGLTYRQASRHEVERLGALRIMPAYDSVQCDDEIHGTYDGLPISITEARLKRRQNKRTVVAFDGLLVSITLPRSLTGTTVILTDRGVWENFKARWTGPNLETVRLEHQEFEERYEVQSSDQIEARALLTPAFMERFVELAARSESSVPGAIAEGNTLIVAVPKRFGGSDLFEPPPYWKPAGGAALVQLETDIKSVLRMADTVIKLDFWAAGRQRDVARSR